MKFSAVTLNVKTCQSCRKALGDTVYDSPNVVHFGRWAYFCEACFNKWGHPGVATKHHNRTEEPPKGCPDCGDFIKPCSCEGF